jgi:hypothetical protein
LVATVGAVFTESVAAAEVALLQEFVNTARYLLLFCAAVEVKESVVEVAPGRSLNIVPPSLLSCHWTVGFGLPLAAAVNVAVAPSQRVLSVGFALTAGTVFKLSVAGLDVAVTPKALLPTASYPGDDATSAAVTEVIVNKVVVVPEIWPG